MASHLFAKLPLEIVLRSMRAGLAWNIF